ncbi:riboflavin synthase [Pediococcus siamensis]|uniref:riboflavin synthase n=1 Tax=Pediococcus siamensis TaxID=381829 RepID=UPI00399F05F1
MFTGIIKDMGVIKKVQNGSDAFNLRIETALTNQIHSKLGDSIAVNGVCLTITKLYNDGFEVNIMPETVRRTNVHQLQEKSQVNLEPALLPTDRIDGHFVLGHVDTTATLIKKQVEKNAVTFSFKFPHKYARYIVEKGSIALDGVSLTIVSVYQSTFSVSLIPHTLEHTILKQLQMGSLVNLETDILGKYILNQGEK